MEGQEKQIAITTASAADAQALADLFIGHITAHPEYISHGEIQMGVGVGAVQEDRFITCPAPDARERWMRYILSEMSNDAIAHVWKAVDAQGTLMGFCVAVKCINGTFVGKNEDNVLAFKGIPFVARQPMGDLRWKAPVACIPDNGVYEAYYYGKTPLQPEVACIFLVYMRRDNDYYQLIGMVGSGLFSYICKCPVTCVS